MVKTRLLFIWNIPNALTLLRVALIPVLAGVFYLPFESARLLSAILFTLAAVTDWLDGHLARRWGQFSAFGAFLDPVADKLIVAVALILLVQDDPTPWLALPAAVIVGREIAISALREWMAELGARSRVAVGWLGKFKTAAQMTAIVLLLWRDNLGPFPIRDIGYVLLYAAAVLTLLSMIQYLRSAWPRLMG
ncbi:MAG: CDP-diacylglycerol--glycerol-3-phosphate 3-phosphatidyltransferase [Pseudomonadota bacterium]